MQKWLKEEKLKHCVFGGLSVFDIKYIAETYGLEKANEFVKAVYQQAAKEYGKFKTKKLPTYTKFIKI